MTRLYRSLVFSVVLMEELSLGMLQYYLITGICDTLATILITVLFLFTKRRNLLFTLYMFITIANLALFIQTEEDTSGKFLLIDLKNYMHNVFRGVLPNSVNNAQMSLARSLSSPVLPNLGTVPHQTQIYCRWNSSHCR